MVPRTKKSTPVNVTYLETLRKCTKTVMDLYTKHISSFPEEYIALVAASSSPNGTILRIPKKQPTDGVDIKFMRYKKGDLDMDDDAKVLDLINSWVYLEKDQTPLNYLQNYFKFIINTLDLSTYRIKQMYLDLELDLEDDYKADPDYNPDLDTEDYSEELEFTEGDEDLIDNSHDSSESSGSGVLDTTEFEFKTPGEETDYEDGDSDKSPDYVPSVESEDEYENNHRNVLVISKKPAARNTRKTRKVVKYF